MKNRARVREDTTQQIYYQLNPSKITSSWDSLTKSGAAKVAEKPCNKYINYLFPENAPFRQIARQLFSGAHRSPCESLAFRVQFRRFGRLESLTGLHFKNELFSPLGRVRRSHRPTALPHHQYIARCAVYIFFERSISKTPPSFHRSHTAHHAYSLGFRVQSDRSNR